MVFNFKTIIFIISISLLSAHSLAEAHQPNFSDKLKIIEISNPEISQAFYGYLSNSPVSYKIDSKSDLNLYIGLLTPDIPNIQNNLSASINDDQGRQLANINGSTDFAWQRYYEEFGGDWYWKGPEFEKSFSAGKYTITIYNPTNQGEYVLVVGKLESFPMNKVSKMFSELSKIKTEFFHKPWYSLFQNKIGEFLGLGKF